MSRHWTRFALAGVIVLLGLSACSLAGDVTPPPGSRVDFSAPAETVAAPAAAPVTGQALYAERCAPCHGLTGWGEGELAPKSPVPVPALASDEIARVASPVVWYEMLTNGTMQQGGGMPPFASLSDAQRWSAVAYAYLLSTSQEELAAGQSVFVAQCQACHGPDGRGGNDWTKLETLGQLSNQDLVDFITRGTGEMPAFGEKLTEAERWAAAAYVRALSLAAFNPGEAPAQRSSAPAAGIVASETPAVTETPAAGATPAASETPAAGETPAVTETPAAPATVTITGKVSLASGDALPAGLPLEVMLQAYDSMKMTFSLTTPAAPDGSYKFENVEMAPDRVFLTVVDYKDVTYNSDILHGTDLTSGQPAVLDITITEPSTDATVLVAERLHVILNLDTPGVLQVANILIVTNPTDKVIVSPSPDQPVVRVALPEGASNLQLEEGGMVTEDNGTVVSYEPVAPGVSQQIVYMYDLPYNNRTDFAMVMPVRVQSVSLILTSTAVSLRSPQLADKGVRNIQNMDVQLFASGELQAGDAVEVTVEKPFDRQPLIIGMGVLALALVGVGIYLLRRSKSAADDVEAEDDETAETIMDAVIALDDQFQAGEISREAYDTRRAELKERLAKLQESE